MRYNPALDGLRAVAVIMVMACHCLGHSFLGGMIGVDIFFVLSGFLITTILLREMRETGGISLGNFYFRRSLRLFPALGILVAFELCRAKGLTGAAMDTYGNNVPAPDVPRLSDRYLAVAAEYGAIPPAVAERIIPQMTTAAEEAKRYITGLASHRS